MISKNKRKSKKILKLTNALLSYENGMKELGVCISNFQMIEEILSSNIARLINRNKTIGKIVSSELSFRAKVSVYRSLLIYHNKNVKLSKDLDELISRIFWAEQERNKLVHSIWDSSENSSETIIRRKTSCKKQGLTIDVENFTEDDLRELSNLYNGIATDIDYLTNLFINNKRK